MFPQVRYQAQTKREEDKKVIHNALFLLFPWRTTTFNRSSESNAQYWRQVLNTNCTRSASFFFDIVNWTFDNSDRPLHSTTSPTFRSFTAFAFSPFQFPLARPAKLGLPNPVTVIDLSCTSVFIKGANRLVIAWKGWFFDAVRVRR